MILLRAKFKITKSVADAYAHHAERSTSVCIEYLCIEKPTGNKYWKVNILYILVNGNKDTFLNRCWIFKVIGLIPDLYDLYVY